MMIGMNPGLRSLGAMVGMTFVTKLSKWFRKGA
jgi:hypothetical protein